MWRVAEVAEALNTSVPAVHSALQRARPRLAEQKSWDEATPEVEAAVDEFVRRWEARDIDGLVGLLTDDASMAMPPAPMWFSGPDEIGAFFDTVPAEGMIDLIRLVRTGANGQPAVAAYMPAPHGGHRGYVLMVFDLSGTRIRSITGFQDPRLMSAFALPATLPSSGR